MFSTQGVTKLEVGKQYRVLLRQKGLNSKTPWVAAEFSYGNYEGKVKSETYGADGKDYLRISLPEYPGSSLIFRIDESKQNANGTVVQVTLFLWA